MAFFGDALEGPFFTAIIVKLNENIFETMNIESGMSIKYNIINHIENFSRKKSNFIAINLYENNDNKMAILYSSSKEPGKREVEWICMKILEYIEHNLKISAIISVSNYVKDPFRINEVFFNATEVMRYGFFLPNSKILYQIDLQKHLLSTDEIPEMIMLNLESALNSSNIEMAEKALSKLVYLIQKENYSIEKCYIAMRRIIDCVLQDAKDTDMEIYYKIKDYTQNSILLSKCIYDFVHIIESVIKDVFEYKEQKKANKNQDKIEKVKAYIENNIYSDLSLNILSDMISVTPQYLCKLFKDYTGMNYQHFLTKLKMEEAARLIKNTHMTVNEIAQKLRYNNPSHFIRKFREIYGQTPRDFREKEAV